MLVLEISPPSLYIGCNLLDLDMAPDMTPSFRFHCFQAPELGISNYVEGLEGVLELRDRLTLPHDEAWVDYGQHWGRGSSGQILR